MIQFVNHIIYFFEVVIRKRPEMEIFASKDVPKNNTFFLILLFFCTFGLVMDWVIRNFWYYQKKSTWKGTVLCQSLNSFPFVTSSNRPKGKKWQVNEEKTCSIFVWLYYIHIWKSDFGYPILHYYHNTQTTQKGKLTSSGNDKNL